ncbi:Imm49 family immunity protein [Streptomyces virginiae]|uniref:Imm49 family immunity protein n=1 Tax=Streptomyces virginiae TaxID=1961 RepID=UPI0036E6D49E
MPPSSRSFAMPPAVLLSQIVDGDSESFNLALADALEAHRAYYEVADRADGPAGTPVHRPDEDRRGARPAPCRPGDAKRRRRQVG